MDRDIVISEDIKSPKQSKTVKNLVKLRKKKVKGNIPTVQDELNRKKRRKKAKKTANASRKINR